MVNTGDRGNTRDHEADGERAGAGDAPGGQASGEASVIGALDRLMDAVEAFEALEDGFRREDAERALEAREWA